MNETILLGLAFAVGIVLGLFFFGGLWLTVKIATTSKIPGLWFFGSLTIRMAIALLGFYYIGAGNFIGMISCFLGFFISRYLVLRLTKAYDLTHSKEEASNET